MKKIKITAILLALSLLVISPTISFAKTMKWNLQAFMPPGTVLWDDYLLPFAELVDQMSGGRIQIKIQPPGAVVSQKDISKAIFSGIVEMGFVSTSSDVGYIPEAAFTPNLPFSFRDAYQALEFWYSYRNGEAYDIVNNAYHKKGGHLLALINFHDNFGAMTKFPVTSVSDFRGKKMDASGAYTQGVKALGAETVTLGIVEIYTSLQTGVIDGMIMPFSAMEDFKWKEVINYAIEPAWIYGCASGVEINYDLFQSLPADLQAILTVAARQVNMITLIPRGEAVFNKAMKSATEAGVKIVRLTGDEEIKFKNATIPLWKYAEGLSPQNAKLMSMLKDYLDAKGITYPGK